MQKQNCAQQILKFENFASGAKYPKLFVKSKNSNISFFSQNFIQKQDHLKYLIPLLEQAAKYLCAFNFVFLKFHPPIIYDLPFLSHSFQTRSFFTHTLELSSKEQLWKGFNRNVKRKIKASNNKDLKVATSSDISLLIQLLKDHPEEYYSSLFPPNDLYIWHHHLEKHKACKLYLCVDSQENILHASYYLKDKDTLYYLLSINTPKGRLMNANTHTLWQCMQDNLHLRTLNFCGSKKLSIGRYFLSLGAIPKAYTSIFYQQNN